MLRAAVWKATGRSMAGTLAAAWAGRVLAIAVFIVMNLLYVRDGTIQPFGLVLAVFMAMFIWFGATRRWSWPSCGSASRACRRAP